MTPSTNSLRLMRQHYDKIIHTWSKSYLEPNEDFLNLYNNYINNCTTPDILNNFNIKIENYMVNFLQKNFDNFLKNKTMTVKQVDELIYKQPIENVRHRMWSLVDIWLITYETPVPQLNEISKSDQNVHDIFILKKTNDGILILENYQVPENQKTLVEIGKIWLKLFNNQDVIKVLNDMKYWIALKNVMHKSKNIYKNVLRGLWAKINNYSGSIRDELINRLWEECSDAVGLCADGHVSRLINVLSGYDNSFTNLMSPMEYFQHNMSLISNSDAPIEFKINNANKLMDEINMSSEDRQVWLEAF